MLPQFVVDKIKGNKWLLVAAAVCVIPYFAFQNMKARKAAEKLTEDAGQGVRVDYHKGGDVVTYGDGTALPPDGVGWAVVTLAEHKAHPDRLAGSGYEPADADFPVVVFFNLSGFDASGDAAAVRRAADGKLLFEVKDRPRGPVAGVTPLPDGTFKVYYRDGFVDSVKADDWYRAFTGDAPVPPAPPADQLDKLSDEELAKYGLTRMAKDEYEKKYGKPADSKTGVRGKVIRVGGQPAVEPLAGVTIAAVAGTDPAAPPAATAVTDKDGGYALPVPPGVYTIVATVDGKPRGNAANPSSFPATKVGDGWLDYEFRVPR